MLSQSESFVYAQVRLNTNFEELIAARNDATALL